MGQNVTNNIEYLIALKHSKKEVLSSIRHWQGLSIASEGQSIWVKGFKEEQMQSATLNSIPFIQRYTSKQGKLFPFGKLLPVRNIPALLWTPIERAIRLELPSLNHNFFEFQEGISLALLPSEQEKAAIGMRTTLDYLEAFIQTAPTVRLEHLRWTLIGTQMVFLLGTPTLALPGQMYWNRGNFLLPVGYDLNFPLLGSYFDAKINPENDNWVVWTEASDYYFLPKTKFEHLSIGSFRLTQERLSAIPTNENDT